LMLNEVVWSKNIPPYLLSLFSKVVESKIDIGI